MKKTMMTIVACLLIAAAATAQGVKVSAKMEKGMKKTYQSEIVMNVGGKEVKFGAKQNYVVADRLPDGYRLDCSTSDFTSNVTDDDVMGMLILLGQQMNEGMTVSLKTDDDGKVLGLLNGDEVRQHGMDTFDVLLNRLFEKHPEAAQMMPREALKAQVTAQLSDDNLLQSVQEFTNILALNGRQIMTGSQEEHVNTSGLKMQRTYFLTKKDGSSITTTSKMNMTKDEIKQMIIAQIEKAMPEQAEMIKQNIDMMMGQLTFDASEKATYDFGPDGWITSLKAETTNDAMGQKTATTASVTLLK